MSSQKLENNYEKAAQIFDKYVECNGTDTEPKTKKWIEKYMKDNDVEQDTFFNHRIYAIIGLLNLSEDFKMISKSQCICLSI